MKNIYIGIIIFITMNLFSKSYYYDYLHKSEYEKNYQKLLSEYKINPDDIVVIYLAEAARYTNRDEEALKYYNLYYKKDCLSAYYSRLETYIKMNDLVSAKKEYISLSKCDEDEFIDNFIQEKEHILLPFLIMLEEYDKAKTHIKETLGSTRHHYLPLLYLCNNEYDKIVNQGYWTPDYTSLFGFYSILLYFVHKALLKDDAKAEKILTELYEYSLSNDFIPEYDITKDDVLLFVNKITQEEYLHIINTTQNMEIRSRRYFFLGLKNIIDNNNKINYLDYSLKNTDLLYHNKYLFILVNGINKIFYHTSSTRD